MGMTRCRRCGHQTLLNPGLRCPGCGYMYDYLKRYAGMEARLLKSLPEEVAIRRLRCVINGTQPADCVITNRGLRLCDKEEGKERMIPFDAIRAVTRARGKAGPAGFFMYRCEDGEKLDLRFFPDRAILTKCPDIDRQVMRMTRDFCKAGLIAAGAKGPSGVDDALGAIRALQSSRVRG